MEFAIALLSMSTPYSIERGPIRFGSPRNLLGPVSMLLLGPASPTVVLQVPTRCQLVRTLQTRSVRESTCWTKHLARLPEVKCRRNCSAAIVPSGCMQPKFEACDTGPYHHGTPNPVPAGEQCPIQGTAPWLTMHQLCRIAHILIQRVARGKECWPTWQADSGAATQKVSALRCELNIF